MKIGQISKVLNGNTSDEGDCGNYFIYEFCKVIDDTYDDARSLVSFANRLDSENRSDGDTVRRGYKCLNNELSIIGDV